MASYKFFDTSFYLNANPDVVAAWTGSAADHYTQHGAAEGRAPAPWFDATYYRATYPDLASMSAAELFQHYNSYGYAEGRVTASNYTGFDAARYLADNPDIVAAGYTENTALSHFLVYGQAEGRDAFNVDGDIIVGTSGSNYTLTTSEDHLNGTAGADVFTAPSVDGLLGIQSDTLQSVDVINGGGGKDTLQATIASPVGLLLGAAAPIIDSVETVNLRFAGIAAGGLDLANATGIEQLNVANSSTMGQIFNTGNVAELGVSNQLSDVVFNGHAGSAVTLNASKLGNATTTTAVVVDNGALSSVALNVTDSNLALVTTAVAPGVTSLAVKAAGANTLALGGAESQLVNVTVTGAGDLNVATRLNGPLKSFDASAATGDIVVDVNSTAKVAVSTGSGDDSVALNNNVVAGSTVATGTGNDLVRVGANLNLLASAAGGDGTDIINVTDGADITATTALAVSGFEVLDISGGTGTYDQSLIAFTKVQIDEAIGGTLTGAVTLSNVADTSTLNVMSEAKTDPDLSLQAITVLLKTPAGVDSTTIDVAINDGNKDNIADGNVTFANYTAAGVENVTINSVVATTDGGLTAVKDSAYKTTVTALDLDAVKTLTLSGTSSIEITTLTNTGNSLTNVNASASNGNITLDVSALTSQVAYAGAAGVDTYTATDGGSIYGGAGNDVIKLSGAAVNQDTLIYKAASDSTLTVTGTKVDLTKAESITGFTTVAASGMAVAPDTLDISTFGFSGYAAGAAVSKGAVTAATFDASIADFFADAGGDRGVAFATDAGDTYVFVDANKDGDWSATTDLAIKLVAVADFAVTSVTF